MSWLRRIRNISIHNKIMILLLAVIFFISIVLSILSYHASEETILEQTENSISTSLDQTVKRFDLFMHNAQSAALSVGFSGNLKKLLTSTTQGTSADYDNLLRVIDLTTSFNNANSYVYLMEIYDFHNHIQIPSKGGVKPMDLESEEYQFLNKRFFSGNITTNVRSVQWIPSRVLKLNGVMKNVVTLIIPIVDDNSYKVTATVMTYIPDEYVTRLCNELSGIAGDVVILDETMKVIFASDAALIGTSYANEIDKGLITVGSNVRTLNGNNDLVTMQKSDYLNWTFLSMISTDKIMEKNTKALRDSFILISLTLVVIAAFVSVTINSLIYKPMRNLLRQIKDMGMEKPVDKSGLVYRNDEIGFLFRSFTDILIRNRELVENNFQQKLHMRDAEIRLLYSQINPHFLYNTLDTVIWMMRFQQFEEAETLVKAMIRFFRLSLNKGKEIIYVHDVKEQLESYFTIQQFRYSDRLTASIDFAESILSKEMLALILQPVVENAIYHGIEKKTDAGFIKVTGREENGTLVFYVEDNGVGASKQRVEEINAIIHAEEQSEDNYYALQNINRRIKLFYGESYGVRLESVEGLGTCVIIRIPVL